MDNWPFADPPNVATFTVRQIIDREHPILMVCHDDDDGSWQFLTGNAIDMADAMLVGLQEMVRRDPSLSQLADLPLGWKAWRNNSNETWQRAPI